jgi:hypothetical protein
VAELERSPLVTRIELHRFTRAEAGAQLRAIAGRDLAPEVMDRFYARSEGNAFYAEELIAAASSGAARRTSGTGKGCPPPGNPASTTRSPSSNGFAVLPDMPVRASAAVALSLRLCALVNPDDSAAERGPGPRYVLDDH